MEDIRLSKKEIKYSEIISQVVAGETRQARASEILGVSLRHIKRLCKRYRTDGITAIPAETELADKEVVIQPSFVDFEAELTFFNPNSSNSIALIALGGSMLINPLSISSEVKFPAGIAVSPKY